MAASAQSLFAARGSAAEIEQGLAFQPKFDADGLIPAIVTDAASGDLLMFAWMNAESLAATIETRIAHFWSRSRAKLWKKGEESGNVQQVLGIYLDCDADTILLKVKQVGGAACHEGYQSCFFRQITPAGLKVVGERVFDPQQVYKKN